MGAAPLPLKDADLKLTAGERPSAGELRASGEPGGPEGVPGPGAWGRGVPSGRRARAAPEGGTGTRGRGGRGEGRGESHAEVR